jgi:hypothetical protein
MSYREQDGQVILTLSREDYNELIEVHRLAIYSVAPNYRDGIRDFWDRLNAGNPRYTPYRVEEKKP